MFKKIFSIVLILILLNPTVHATTQLETFTQYYKLDEQNHTVYSEVWEYNV